DFRAGKFLGELLITEVVDRPAGEEDVRGAVRLNTGDRALGVGRSHAHGSMAGLRAHVVGDDPGERLPAGSSERAPGKQTGEEERPAEAGRYDHVLTRRGSSDARSSCPRS